MYLKAVVLGMDQIGLAQDGDGCRTLVNAVVRGIPLLAEDVLASQERETE